MTTSVSAHDIICFLVNTIIFYVTSKKYSENILDSHSGEDMISFRSQWAQDPPCYTLVAQGVGDFFFFQYNTREYKEECADSSLDQPVSKIEYVQTFIVSRTDITAWH